MAPEPSSDFGAVLRWWTLSGPTQKSLTAYGLGSALMIPLLALDRKAARVIPSGSMAQNSKINWQPISQLSFIGSCIDGMLESLEENLENLKAANERHGSMDDATVSRVIQVYIAQRDDLWLYEEQISRWQNAQPTESQKAELSRLIRQMERLRTGLNSALGLADEMKEMTIEKILAKDDVELALEVLSGKMKPPQPR